MTEYYCVKCGNKLTDVKEEVSGDASIIRVGKSFDPILECQVCDYQIRIDHSEDWRE